MKKLPPFQPTFYLRTAAELIEQKEPDFSSWTIIDTLNQQIGEYVKIRNPKKKYDEQNLQYAIKEWLSGQVDLYGCWVLYPWRKTAVHLLEENEFIRLRTSRNCYKITEEEQTILASKCLGIIGLSVGHSAALTMAGERIFGRIKIADMDTLDLSNLNRIRSSVVNIGLPKTVITAREIAELDPYLKIEIFEEGIHADNIDEFLGGEQGVDLLIEECDDLAIKVLAREKARALRIPVLMDTSDRGMIDIERYDLEPQRPLVHGLIPNLSYSDIIKMTKAEKLPITLHFAGIHQLSSRMKASMMELDQTITTWPQLASSVAMGGGIACDLARKILLKQISESGRFYFDEHHRLFKNTGLNSELFIDKPEPLTKERIQEVLGKVQLPASIDVPSPEIITQLVEYANMAPSGGNSQPWKWVYQSGVLHLFHDKHHSASLLDYTDFGSYLSFGACLYNLELASNTFGYRINLHTHSTQYQSGFIASVTFTKGEKFIPPLFDYIEKRHTNRNKGTNQVWDSLLESQLTEVPKSMSSCNLKIISDRDQMKKLGQLAASGERWRILNSQGHHDTFVEELRWTEAAVLETRDGIDVRTLGIPMHEVRAMEVAKDSEAIAWLHEWGKGLVFEKGINDSVETACAIGIIECSLTGIQQWLEGGAFMQHIWLKATQLGLSMQPIAAMLFLFKAFNLTDLKQYLDKNSSDTLISLARDFDNLTGYGSQDNLVFMFKISYAQAHEIKALRRDLENSLMELH